MIEYTLIGILIFLLGIIYYTTFFISQDSLGNIFIKRLKINCVNIVNSIERNVM